MKKSKTTVIEVQGTAIAILAKEHGDYISLTDMVKKFEGAGALIEQWLKNKDTVLFLGVWEQIHNPGFNSHEFEGIRNEAGRNSFGPRKRHARPCPTQLNEIAFRQMQSLSFLPSIRRLGSAPDGQP